MERTDQEYHLKRERECLRMAQAATDPAVRRIHRQLAAEHLKRALTGGSLTSP